jgi:hypothetical protein
MSVSPTPSQLRAMAVRLNCPVIRRDASNRWLAWQLEGIDFQPIFIIGSDADLYDRLLDTMPHPQLSRYQDGSYGCRSTDYEFPQYYGRGSTKLLAVAACVEEIVKEHSR